MQNDVWHEVMRRANFGCVYLKIVAGKDGKPNDYIFLYVNPAFEKMTGLRKDMLIGKRAAEVLLNPGDKLFDGIVTTARSIMQIKKLSLHNI